MSCDPGSHIGFSLTLQKTTGSIAKDKTKRAAWTDMQEDVLMDFLRTTRGCTKPGKRLIEWQFKISSAVAYEQSIPGKNR